jgi:small GTP-binding protein
MNKSPSEKIRLILIGSSSVGKTSLLRRFTEDVYNDDSPYKATLGIDFLRKVINCSGRPIELQIWDTAGEERHRSITHNYYKDVHGCILVFDITNRESFEDLESWIEDLNSYGDTLERRLIIGNKSDLAHQRKIPTFDAAKYATQNGIDYSECSAKNGDEVERAFQKLIDNILWSITNDPIFTKKKNMKSVIETMQVNSDTESQRGGKKMLLDKKKPGKNNKKVCC